MIRLYQTFQRGIYEHPVEEDSMRRLDKHLRSNRSPMPFWSQHVESCSKLSFGTLLNLMCTEYIKDSLSLAGNLLHAHASGGVEPDTAASYRVGAGRPSSDLQAT